MSTSSKNTAKYVRSIVLTIVLAIATNIGLTNSLLSDNNGSSRQVVSSKPTAPKPKQVVSSKPTAPRPRQVVSSKPTAPRP